MNDDYLGEVSIYVDDELVATGWAHLHRDETTMPRPWVGVVEVADAGQASRLYGLLGQRVTVELNGSWAVGNRAPAIVDVAPTEFNGNRGKLAGTGPLAW